MGKILLGIEKRAKVLYVRVRPSVRKAVTDEAKRLGCTESALVDRLLGVALDTCDAQKLSGTDKITL